MNYDDFNRSIQEAERTMSLADLWAERFARIIIKRLRNCNYTTLCSLKRELRDFNMNTGEWKEEA